MVMVKKSHLYITVRFFSILILIQSCVSENKEIVRDENGNIILKCELKNRVRYGKCFEYYPSGTVTRVSNWVAGDQEGETIEYFVNGSIKSTVMWNGKTDGECVDYFENGNIKQRAYVTNGQPSKVEFYDENGRMQKVNYYILINQKSRLNGVVVLDVDNAENYPYNVNFQKTSFAKIFAEHDTIDYGSFAEYEAQWMCNEDYYISAITGKIDHNFNVVDSSSLKSVDLDNKNRFYPSNFKSDTLRVLFLFEEIKDGEHFGFESYLEKVFTIREK